VDSDDIYFPEAADIGAARHRVCASDVCPRRIRARSSLAAGRYDPSFGERRSHQWNARERPERMAKLIRTHLGDDLQETEPIVKLLSDAIGPCDQRNFLAHGEWWSFNTRTLTITVRSRTRWSDGQPDQFEYTAQKIKALVGEFERLETKLFKLRRRIEARHQ
jgi:hypothetical protein